MKKLIENGYGPLVIGIAVAIGIFLGNYLSFEPESGTSLFGANFKNQKVQRLLNYINDEYVEEVNTDSILDVAINHILENLDPHSTYIPANMHQKVKESMEGSFVGIGVQFRMYNDTLFIINVLKGGPSFKAGLHNGDRILLANSDTIYGKNIISDSIIGKLKGREGTEVDLKIYRPTSKETFIKTITRGKVPLKSVDVAYMINDSLGYVKINRFAGTTYDEFDKSLTNLLNLGMKSLILDLRDNPGGFMHIAKQIADEFLHDKRLIVYTKNRKGEEDREYSTGEGKFQEGNLYVLINENSASASEVVSGALQDNDRGTIVGRRSFGKGLVQQELDLGDGSAVRLTTARYYTPTGRSIQKSYSNGKKSYYSDYSRRLHSGELINKDSIHIDDTLKFVTPNGKIVYGGGGIIPDVFVPVDTTNYERWVYQAIKYSNLSEFFLNYVDTHRLELEKTDYHSFRKNFDSNGAIYNEYLEFLKRRGIRPTADIRAEEILKLRIKAYTASLVWGDEKMYPIWDEIDPMIIKVESLEGDIK
jgi:carboxyl-terminal processing protease